jgi:hypothetical protein
MPGYGPADDHPSIGYQEHSGSGTLAGWRLRVFGDLHNCVGGLEYGPKMPEEQRLFWSAIVQIVPVLLLALVVEARTIRVDRERLVRDLQELRVKRDMSRLSGKLSFAAVGSWRSMFGGFTAAYAHLVVAAALVACEMLSLWTIAQGEPTPRTAMGLAMIAVALGVVHVGLYPVALRMVVAFRDSTEPLVADTRAHPELPARSAE